MRAAAALVLVVLTAPAWTTSAAPAPAWSTATIPMERQAFAELVGLDPELPRTLLLAQAVRRLHDADVRGTDLRARVVEALRAARGGTVRVPLPLDAGTWCRSVLPRCRPETVVTDLLADPRGSLMYLGLGNLDAGTRAQVAGMPRLLEWIAREHPGALAAFGDAIRVRDGNVIVPGDERSATAWAGLVGVPVTAPDAFVRALLTVRGGRLAYFYDTAAHLDPARRRLALGPTAASAAAMAGAFESIDPSWNVETRPFLRPPIDASTVMLRLMIGKDERLAGPRSKAFWTLALDPDAAEADEPGVAGVLGGDETDAAWLVDRVAGRDSRRRLGRLQALLYGQRVLPALDDATAADAIDVVRAAMRMPALVFPLERAGITDLRVVARLVHRARGLTAIPDAQDRALVLAEWQSGVALVLRSGMAGSLRLEQMLALLDELAGFDHENGRFGDRLARWITTRLVPSLRTAVPATAADGLETQRAPEAEPVLLDGLAGPPPAAAPSIDWEGTTYVLDRAAAERARLAMVRERQGAAGLDDALEAFAISSAGTDDGRALAARAKALGDRLPRTPGPTQDTDAAIARLERTLDAPRVDARAVAKDRLALARAAEGLLASALRALVYAVALGSPEDRLFLAGDVSARHDFGVERPGMPPGPSPPWAFPAEQALAGTPWHMTGSLLGLDVSLGRLRLQRLLGTMPAHQAVVGASSRAVLVQTMAMTPDALSDGDARAIVDAMNRGRTRVRTAEGSDSLASLCAEAGVCGWRAEVLAWARAEEPESVLATVSRAELAWAGRADDAVIRDAWGTAASAIDGRLAVTFPRPWPIELVSGRPTLAHALTQFADLKLRLAELLVELQLPGTLVRELNAAALQDFIDEVEPTFPDDWLAFVHRADRLSRDRAGDYISTLAVPGGALVARAGRGGAR